MPPIIVEPKKTGNGYRATLDGNTVATGKTQQEAGQKAHEKKPQQSVVAARVREVEGGSPDKFRHLFSPKKKQ